MRGATLPRSSCESRHRHFNPRSPCGERLEIFISLFWAFENFNPRSPCGERHDVECHVYSPFIFQPTLPMRGATHRRGWQARCVFISTHAPHAGSDLHPGRLSFDHNISTHAPHAGSDRSWLYTALAMPISTHAPHAGSDPEFRRCDTRNIHFNPRSPCGERPLYFVANSTI